MHFSNDEIALKGSSENGHLKVAKFILKHGSNVHADNNYALKWARTNGHFKIAKLLRKHGATK